MGPTQLKCTFTRVYGGGNHIFGFSRGRPPDSCISSASGPKKADLICGIDWCRKTCVSTCPITQVCGVSHLLFLKRRLPEIVLPKVRCLRGILWTKKWQHLYLGA